MKKRINQNYILKNVLPYYNYQDFICLICFISFSLHLIEYFIHIQNKIIKNNDEDNKFKNKHNDDDVDNDDDCDDESDKENNDDNNVDNESDEEDNDEENKLELYTENKINKEHNSLQNNRND